MGSMSPYIAAPWILWVLVYQFKFQGLSVYRTPLNWEDIAPQTKYLDIPYNYSLVNIQKTIENGHKNSVFSD